MKRITYAVLSTLMLTIASLFGNPNDFTISIEPSWKNLEHDDEGKSSQFGGKWILAGTITFKKKKADEAVHLHKLELHWHGAQIETLITSLYKKNFDPMKKDFLPIEDYLLCDGIWNKTKQTLLLNFESKQTLGPIETFYLVLTVPEQIEHTLKGGFFSLESTCLPDQFKKCTQGNSLALALNTLK
jgi:hypothetical protein